MKSVWTWLGAALAMSTPALAQTFNLEYEHVPGELIVTFKDDVAAESYFDLLEVKGARVERRFRKVNGAVVSFKGMAEKALDDYELYAKAKELAALPNVRSVEANTILRVSRVPNDPQFGELYGLHNEGATGGTVDADIDAPEAWQVTTGSRDVLVGVIDTGIDYTHPDIAPNYWTNPGETGLDENGNDKRFNGIDDDGNGYVDDWRGWDFVNNDNDPMDDNDHGTHCAGTIGAKGDDGVGVVGVNWDVSLVGIKFLSGAGSGTLANAVLAIEYATSIGVDLTSNSWGGGGYSEAMFQAIQAANDAGILFVAAAGNSRSNNDVTPNYPSNYDVPNVIAVSATDHNDQLASFSSYGKSKVHVAAPGVDILSSTPGGRYQKFSGTSMATPHVAGLAALIKSAYPDATAEQIKARILNTVDPIPALAERVASGGRINAANALELDSIAPGAATGLAVKAANVSSVQVMWNAAGDDGDVGLASRYEVRYAAQPIVTMEDWEAATVAQVELTSARDASTVEATISGLALNSSGYFAVRAYDNVGNAGAISESAAFSVLPVALMMNHDANTLDGVTADAPWGLENLPARSGNAFSDSPAGPYGHNLDISLTLDEVAITSPVAFLTFDTEWDLETRYDNGMVEISTDGGATWREIDRVTGVGAWQTKSYELTSYLEGASAFKLRFRMTTDSSIAREGWKIDNVAVYAPAE